MQDDTETSGTSFDAAPIPTELCRRSGDANSPPDLRPDLGEARRFLEALDPKGVFTFQVFPEGSAKAEAPRPFVLHGTFDELAATLVDLNGRGYGIFVMVNEGDRKGRKSENVIRIRANFVDLDGAPLEPLLSSEAPPHLVVESSPGRWHVYWLVDAYPLDDFQARQQALIDRFSGDPSVKDLCRVLRVPGFYNHKYAAPVMSKLIGVSTKGSNEQD